MAKISDSPLKPNPYLTYRDPETGRWQVIPVNACHLMTDASSSIPQKSSQMS